jgi:regulatory protein
VLEDESEIKSTLAVVSDLRLFSGKDLDEDELNELRTQSMRSIAKERALEYISRRRMSCKEMERKLLDKGIDEETAAYCVSWLLDNRFLDDESYSGAVVRHYAAKGYGPGRIRAELSRRGIDRELWDEALEELPEEDDSVYHQLCRRMRGEITPEAQKKAIAALQRRGFSWGEIRSALDRYLRENEE